MSGWLMIPEAAFSLATNLSHKSLLAAQPRCMRGHFKHMHAALMTCFHQQQKTLYKHCSHDPEAAGMMNTAVQNSSMHLVPNVLLASCQMHSATDLTSYLISWYMTSAFCAACIWAKQQWLYQAWAPCVVKLIHDFGCCRIGLKSFGLFDEAQSPAHRAVLVPAPEIVSRKCLSARSTLRQAFVTWRHQIAAQTSIRRRARDTLGHFYCHPASQICCHIVSGTIKHPFMLDNSSQVARRARKICCSCAPSELPLTAGVDMRVSKLTGEYCHASADSLSC